MSSNTNFSSLRYYRAAFSVVLACCYSASALANHSSPPTGVALVGDLQSELGCPGDWQPDCSASELFNNGSTWVATFTLPAGNWQYKIALNDTWDESYGDNGNNISLSLTAVTSVTFTYDHFSHEVTDSTPITQPTSVTIAGDLQSELGCPGDWEPWCNLTDLGFDAVDGIWQGVFPVGAGNWQYKAALNGSWDVSFGANTGGSNIALNLGAATDVKFYYDHASHWITDDENSVIAVAPGSFQSALGCPGNWQPDCLRSWLQDPNGDGIYDFATREIPAGSYEVKVAHDESWNENYGAGGVQNGANMLFTVPNAGDLVVFTYDPATHLLDIGGELPKGNISEARAYWLTEDTLAWNIPADSVVRLQYSHDASLAITAAGLEGGDSIALARDGVVDGAIAEKFRHLTGLPTYKISAADLALVADILKQQFAVAAVDGEGKAVDATGVQPAGVLDDLYTYAGDLGVTFDSNIPTVRVWAPTARSVNLHLFDDADNANSASAIIPMTRNAATGTWILQGDAGWNYKYFLFEVEVYARSAGQVVTNLVTDPYSHSLSMDSKRTQIVNLANSELKPRRWDRLRKPRLKAPEDIAIYELHVRDFSMSDMSVPAPVRGTFMAFALPETRSTRHLRKLSRSGLSHVHLLPSFDCASVPENRSAHATPGDLSAYAPDGVEQQEAINAIRDQDGFNWCYDPFHYTAPEGSYSTNPDGATRVLEFREMVAGLNHSGLRVVMDVVYNHTSGSLQGEKSVLDRIVPDYYHRLNNAGFIESSSCCSNTATEHNMMEKLMLDSLRTWATAYKVDGFRFDLMGHHSRANIEKARDMLRSLTLEADGVDGSDIYIYGEGWNFGEVANDARFVQATQINMGDNSGVGTFNDRMRDGVRGGGPFDSGTDHVRRQGFINGMYFDPNSENSGSAGELDELLRLADWIRIGLAGSIGDYQFTDRFGNLVMAKDVDYPGQGGAGYTSDPQEVINYVASHDNETLFDINQYKLPRTTSTDDRIRAQNLGNSILALSQGVLLFNAGQDMLRSKSMDRNSFNSGDWFNVLDFSYELSGWGRGLPPFGDNGANWAEQQSLLADPRIGVDRRDIKGATKHMLEMLQVRNSSKLFRLRTGEEVMQRIEFHNTGPEQVPGLIVMSLRGDEDIEVVVLINASTESQEFFFDSGEDSEFELHEIQEESRDRIVRESDYDDDDKMFFVPARTTAVFVADD